MAGQVTYDSLFTLVQKQIENSLIFNNATPLGSQLGNRTNASIAVPQTNASSVTGTASTTQLMSAIQQLLAQALPQRIISGLYVTAADPISNVVNISAGSGTVGGIVYSLDLPTQVAIPFDSINNVFYINLINDAVKVNTTGFAGTELTLAKIVVPQPGTTFIVQDKYDSSSPNAYINMYQTFSIFADQNCNLEEDSLEFFRDNIGCILADNLIGNIELSENLKVTNSQGTLEIDSNSLTFFDGNGDTLSIFNTDGICFLSPTGTNLAHFTTTEAMIGNILIETDAIQSRNFVSGAMGQGFQICDNGNAQFNNICARGILQSTVFQSETVSAVGGNLLVLNSDTLACNMQASSTSCLVTCGNSGFLVGDTLRIKNAVNDEWLQVVSCTLGSCTYCVCRDMARSYIPAMNPPAWTTGTAVLDYGQTGSGGLYMTASDNHAPFLQMFVNNGNPWSGTCVCTVLGNLSGVTDPILGLLSGYGLYSGNVYLTGCLFASHIASALTGSRIDFNTSCFFAYDNSNSPVFQLCFGSTNTGDLIIGNTAFDYLQWSGTAHCLSFCSKSGICSVKIGGGSITANSVTLQDPTCACNYSYLSAGSWFFHDTLGNTIPYIRRMCSGIIGTGCNVVLCGWTQAPQVIVGVSSMLSYNASNSASCQAWCVFNDSPVFFCTSSSCFGYCFGVHACLSISAGVFPVCNQNAAFATCVITNPNVACTTIITQFSLWATDVTVADFYCYGTICYAICYKCCCAGCAWCACSYTYTQPHSSLSDLLNCTTQSNTITFAAPGCYYLMGVCCSVAWTVSSIPQASANCCCRTLTAATRVLCSGSGNITFSVCCQLNLTGSNPSSVFCNISCVCWCSNSNTFVNMSLAIGCWCLFSNIFMGCTLAQVGACDCSGGGCTSGCIGYGSPSPTTVITDLTSFGSTAFTCLLYCVSNIMVVSKGSINDSVDSCFLGGCLIQCYNTFCSGATCIFTDLLSTQDTSTSATVLDPNGVLSWLAVSA